MTCVAFSIKFAKTNQEFAENSEFKFVKIIHYYSKLFTGVLSCTPEVSNLRLREIAPIPAAGDPRLVGPLVSAEDYAAKVAGGAIEHIQFLDIEHATHLDEQIC